MASTSTVYLTDLYREAHPEADATFSALVATASNLGGLALARPWGALAQWVPAPMRTSYVVFGALMVALVVIAVSTPETVDTELADPARPVRFAFALAGTRVLRLRADRAVLVARRDHRPVGSSATTRTSSPGWRRS